DALRGQAAVGQRPSDRNGVAEAAADTQRVAAAQEPAEVGAGVGLDVPALVVTPARKGQLPNGTVEDALHRGYNRRPPPRRGRERATLIAGGQGPAAGAAA